MKSRHDRYFDTLEIVAKAMTPMVKGHRVAALLVHKRQIVSIGICRNKTHPLQKRFADHPESIFLHAELDCLTQALRMLDVDDLPNATMYILRLKKPHKGAKGFLRAMARPCENGCMGAIKAFEVGRVFYTTEDGGYEEL